MAWLNYSLYDACQPRPQAPLCTYMAEALRDTESRGLSLLRGSWTPISRVLAAGLPQCPDELPHDMGAHRLPHVCVTLRFKSQADLHFCAEQHDAQI